VNLYLRMFAYLLLLTGVHAAATPKIAVVDFDTHQYSAQLPGAQLADYVTDELVNCGLFEVIEREKLASVMREIAFGQSGMADPATASQFGRVLGAQYLLTGRVVSLEREEKSFSGYGVNTRNTVLTLSVALRIVDVQSGSIRFSGRTRTQRVINEAGGLSVGANSPHTALAEKAAMEMVQEIVKSGRFSGEQSAGTAATARGVKVTVLSVPEGADVEVDGIFYGNTGGELTIPAGMRRIRITLAGYQPWEKQVMVNDGAKFTATLAPERVEN
jgi:hypothetical protein